MKSTFLAMAAALAFSTAAAAQQHIVVPAFFPLAQVTDPAKGTDWSRIHAAGPAVQIVVPEGEFATLSGMGLTDAQTQFNAERSVGQTVLGYVDTAFGPGVDQNTILANVDNWYAHYPSQIDGIFYDDGPLFRPNGPTDGQLNSYYVQLYQSTKFRHPSATVMLNAAAFPNDWIMTAPAADLATSWEDTLNNYVNHYNAIGPGGNLVAAPAWWSDPIYTSRGKLASIVFGATQLDVGTVVNLSRNRGTPTLYVFDRPTANYAGVACFFEQEVAAVQNQPPVAGKTFCGSACTDITSDNGNCGACGHACGTGQHCDVASCAANFNCSSCACGCRPDGNSCAAPVRCFAKCQQQGGFCDPCLGCVF